MKIFKRPSKYTILVIIICILFTTQLVKALEIPALKTRVNDLADLLQPVTKGQLESALSQLEQTDSTQVVILTVPSLEGQSLEDFSIRVVDQWKLGQKTIDNGVLLLVAKKERKIRIEVGYGLEGKLTDLMTGRIIRNVIVPQFKMGRFDQGITDGIAAIVGVVRGEFSAQPSNQRRKGMKNASPNFMGLIALILIINMLGRVNRFIGAVAGGLMTPIAGIVLLNTGLMASLLLIPLGIAAGLLIGILGGPLSFGHMSHHRSGRSSIFGGFGGGFGSSGGGGGFGGGFGGGGGGFGGGGASGDW